jgi:hypothetical protein
MSAKNTQRWRRARRARPNDYNVVNGQVPWYTAVIRYLKDKPEKKK